MGVYIRKFGGRESGIKPVPKLCGKFCSGVQCQNHIELLQFQESVSLFQYSIYTVSLQIKCKSTKVIVYKCIGAFLLNKFCTLSFRLH